MHSFFLIINYIGDIVKKIVCILVLIIITILFIKQTEQDLIGQRKKVEVLNFYKECMNKPFQSESTKQNIQHFLNKYQQEYFGLYFDDLINQYTILKNANKVYYGASLIKLLEAVYILDNHEIDLNTKLVYSYHNQKNYSLGMDKYLPGSVITIKDLITYTIEVSDNTAHEILLNYIGLETLRNYSLTLGMDLSISASDHYGYLTPEDCNKLLKTTYQLISKNDEKSIFLKELMNNPYYNALSFEDITLIHKYGLYDNYYNDIGIYLGDYPYLISILTYFGKEDYTNKVQKISQEIYEIYKNNLEEKENYCNQTNKKLYYNHIAEHKN